MNNCGRSACRISCRRLMGKWREKLLNGASYGGKTGPDDWIKKAVERELSCFAWSFLIRYFAALDVTLTFSFFYFMPFYFFLMPSIAFPQSSAPSSIHVAKEIALAYHPGRVLSNGTIKLKY